MKEFSIRVRSGRVEKGPSDERPEKSRRGRLVPMRLHGRVASLRLKPVCDPDVCWTSLGRHGRRRCFLSDDASPSVNGRGHRTKPRLAFWQDPCLAKGGPRLTAVPAGVASVGLTNPADLGGFCLCRVAVSRPPRRGALGTSPARSAGVGMASSRQTSAHPK